MLHNSSHTNITIQQKSYSSLRKLIILLIAFGSPLNLWLNEKDRYKILYDKYHKLWILYRIYCWIFMHSVTILNIYFIYYFIFNPLYLPYSEYFWNLLELFIQGIWNLSAIVIINSFYRYINYAKMIIIIDFELQFKTNISTETYVSENHIINHSKNYDIFIWSFGIINCILIFGTISYIWISFVKTEFFSLYALLPFTIINIFYVSLYLIFYYMFCRFMKLNFKRLAKLTKKYIQSNEQSAEVLAIITKR